MREVNRDLMSPYHIEYLLSDNPKIDMIGYLVMDTYSRRSSRIVTKKLGANPLTFEVTYFKDHVMIGFIEHTRRSIKYDYHRIPRDSNHSFINLLKSKLEEKWIEIQNQEKRLSKLFVRK